MNTPFPVAIGCDGAGYELKELLKRHIESLGYPVTDFGTHSTAPVLYPDIALAVATA
ncbi:RpiB/LacA/LacB family sugar-phosphate isomerase, partial [Pseudomonas syringae pv. actinidiae]|nr:RpiB/LacA/LacB family sugar-phosphate isomerase [Pseudomonas syringae pv. actinidiae]